MEALSKSGIVGLFVLLLCGKAIAGPLEDAKAAFAQADYKTAVELLKPLAEHGDGEAQQGVGLAYDLGYGVPQSFSTAATWYRQAAEGGNAAGQFRLAFLYDFGLGVPKNQAQAAEWYRKAAEQGLTAAQTRLAQLYIDGLGVGRDYRQAWDWSSRAYAQGDLSAAGLPCQMQQMRTVPPNAQGQTEKWCERLSATFSADPWVGTEPIAPTLTDDQVIAALRQLTGDSFTPHPANPGDRAQYYAAVTMRRPTSMNILPGFNGNYGLMSEWGSARIAIRGIRLSPPFSDSDAGIHIVPEKDLPAVLDGGCSVVHAAYDIARHVALEPRCGGR
jgi:hypothetical protein